MTSNPFAYVYIGNTSSFTDQVLFGYCARFGTIVSSLVKNEKFCDFHIVEFSNVQQAADFVRIPVHRIERVVLDVKSYRDLFAEIGLLNVDRKCFLGPIVESRDVSIIVAFYREIDSKLAYRQTREDQEKYILLEFSSRHYASKVFDRQIIPVVSQQRKLTLHKLVHPQQFLNRTVTMENRSNQIYIHGLVERITERMLIDYFNRRVTVGSCRILRDGSRCAVLQLTDEDSVKKVLDVSEITLQGVCLTLRKAPPLMALLSCPKEDPDSTSTDHKATIPPVSSTTSDTSHVQNPLFFLTFENNPVSQPDDHSGWTSPRHTIEERRPSVDVQATASSLASAEALSDATTSTSTTPTTKKPTSTNLLRFLEDCQNELDHIRDEYRWKFQQDRLYMTNEFDQLLTEQRRALDKFDRSLTDQRKRSKR